MSELNRFELEDVEWREYDFEGRTYRINRPIAFFYRSGGETHRVLDEEGTIHVVPAPGQNGCVMRYRKFPGADPVKF